MWRSELLPLRAVLMLSCPRRLSPEAKTEWRRVVPDMQKAGLLIEADRATLELFCATMGDVRELEKELRKNGRTITTPNGCLQPSPAWSQLRQARTDALKCAVQLGLTPKSRKTLGVDVTEDPDSEDFK